MNGPENLLLARLNDVRREAVYRHLRIVSLEQRQVIHDPCERVREVYFPVTAVCSMVSDLHNGDAMQVATIGCEGMTGANLALAEGELPFRTIVHVSGEAYAMNSARFLELRKAEPYFRAFVQRYVLAYLVELGQMVACVGLHRVEERLARWLLLSHDRAQRDDFEMTHDLIAEMLGIRRASVTEAAGELQRRGAIEYSRGRFGVSDRPTLEAAACECYQIIRDAYDRLLKDAAA